MVLATINARRDLVDQAVAQSGVVVFCASVLLSRTTAIDGARTVATPREERT